MIPLSDRRVRAFFDYAADLAAEERGRFLEHLGRGDPVLRATIDRLLAFDGDRTGADGFLASPVRNRRWNDLPRRDASDGSTRRIETDAVDEAQTPSSTSDGASDALPRLDEFERIIERVRGARPARALPVVPGYEVIREVGQGSMGVVYHARQIRLNRPCALKMIPPGIVIDEQATERFVSEAEAFARLRHPNVVQIHTIGEADGQPFLELEYVEGGSLGDALDGTPWAAGDAARLVRAVAEGVAEAHRLGVVHRDLKPGNVLMTRDGTPKVADFGLAKLLDSDSAMTMTGMIMGTPSYMAPEQADGRSREVGAAADVYSLGAILYQLLTGRPPFRGATVAETIEQVKTVEPVPPRRLVPAIPLDLETIAMVCLRKESERRYASADALAEDLARFLAGEPILARRSSFVKRAWRWCRRNPRLAASLAVAATSMTAATALSFALALSQYRAAERLRDEQTKTLAQKQATEEHFQIARSTVDDFLIQMGDVYVYPDAKLERIRDLGRTVFNTGISRYEALVARRPEDSALRAQLGRLYVRLADMMTTGRGQAQAVDVTRKVIALRRRLVRDDPENRVYRLELAYSLSTLGTTLCYSGAYEQGIESLEEALGITEAVASESDDPGSIEALSAVGNNLGYQYCDVGRKDEGVALLERGVEMMERLAELESGARGRGSRLNLINAYTGFGDVLSGEDRELEAQNIFDRGLKLAEGLIREDPGHSAHLSAVPMFLDKKGHSLYRMQRPVEALPLVLRARDRWSEALGDRRYPLEHAAFRGDNRLTLGLVYQALGRTEEALASFRQAEAFHRELVREDSARYWFQCSLALARLYQGGMLQRLGRHDEAIPALKEARAIIEAMPELTTFDRFNLAACLAQMECLARTGRPIAESGTVPDDDETRQFGRRAMELLREAAAQAKPRPSRFPFLFHPDVAPLRDRADFQELVREIGFPRLASGASEVR